MWQIEPGDTRSPTLPPRPKPVPHKPVTHKPDTSPAKAWNDAVAQAKANSPQSKVTVKPGDTMASIAASHGDTLASTEGVNPQIHYPNQIDVGQTINLPKKTPAQLVTGVHNAQVKPVITAMAHANATQTTESWNKVKQTTFNMLMGSNRAAYPDVSAAAEIKQLNALEPGNDKFAAANNAALVAAKQQWTQMGVTKSQLSPIINAYHHATQVTNTVNRSLHNPHVRHDPATDHRLVEAAQHANATLSATIEASLKGAAADAARQAGTNPVAQAQASAAAIAERADNIKSFGPNDSAFTKAVDNAAHDLQVTQPARQVASAYARGGAQAAANTLKAVTGKAGDPAIALQIIQTSQPTIGKITSDMNGLVKGYGPTTEFGQIYGDLSKSVDSATPINLSIQKDGQTSLSVGTTAADLVGKSIATTVPQNLTVTSLQGYYQGAAQGAIGNAEGSALTLATATQLKQQGNRVAASYLVEGAAAGFQGLRSKTASDIQAFSTTTGTSSKLQTTWAPFMTQGQMSKAANHYLTNHPDVRQKADAELAAISQDGDAVVEAKSAYSTYGKQFAGISDQLTINAPKDLSTAAQGLTGSGDSGAAFAVSQSTRLNTAISDTLFPLIAAKGGTSSWQDWPGWGSVRSTRSLLSAAQKNMMKGRILPQKFSDTFHNGTSTGLSALGLALTGLNVSSSGFQWSTPEQAVYSIYSGLGFFKYGGETYNSIAKAGWLQKWNWATYKNSQDSNAGKILTAIFGKDSQSLTKSPAFKSLGFFYYGAGAFTAGTEAANYANSDWVPSAWSSAEALGNAGNAAKPIIERLGSETLAEDVGLASSTVSLVAAAGIAAWQIQSDWRANDAYRADSSNFLQSGLGLNPGLAQVLASAPSSASAALQQYAAAYHSSPGDLLSELNRQWNEHRAYNVEVFINQAARMPVQSDGTYARTQPYVDGNRDGTQVMQIVGNGRMAIVPQPLPAESLGQLNYWSDVLFGRDQVG